MNNKQLFTGVLVIFLTLGLTATATAEDGEDSDDSTVETTVGTQTSVDIDPDTISYTDVVPGALQELTEDDIDRVQVENVGSTSIDRVYMESDVPQETPFATGDESQYSASNFLQIQLDSTWAENDHVRGSLNDYDAGPVYVNRKEFTEVNDLSYIFVDDGYEYGRFRVGDEEYFWALETTDAFTDGGTEQTDLRVGQTAHTQTETGTSDFTGEDGDWISYTVTNSGDTDADGNPVGTADVVIPRSDSAQDGSTDREVTLVVQPDDTISADPEEPAYIARTRFNSEYEGVDLTGEANTDYLFDSSGGDPLEAGDSFQVGTQVLVPRGVAQGSVGSGLLTVTVESDTA